MLSKNDFLRDIWKRIETKLSGQVWRVRAYNPITWEAEPEGSREFKTSLGYTASLSPKHKTKHYHSSSKRTRSQRTGQRQTHLLICRGQKDTRGQLGFLLRTHKEKAPGDASIGRLVWRFKSYSHLLNSPWFGSPSYHLRLRECRPQGGSTLCGNL